jgi:hypothetical protein
MCFLCKQIYGGVLVGNRNLKDENIYKLLPHSGFSVCLGCGYFGPLDDYNYSEGFVYDAICYEEAKEVALEMNLPINRIADIKKCVKVDMWECPRCKTILN